MSINDDELAKEVDTLAMHATAAQRQADRVKRLLADRALSESTVTITEAARRLGLTRQTVSNWVRAGKIHTNRLKRIPLTEIARLQRQTGHPL